MSQVLRLFGIQLPKVCVGSSCFSQPSGVAVY